MKNRPGSRLLVQSPKLSDSVIIVLSDVLECRSCFDSKCQISVISWYFQVF